MGSKRGDHAIVIRTVGWHARWVGAGTRHGLGMVTEKLCDQATQSSCGYSYFAVPDTQRMEPELVAGAGISNTQLDTARLMRALSLPGVAGTRCFINSIR